MTDTTDRTPPPVVAVLDAIDNLTHAELRRYREQIIMRLEGRICGFEGRRGYQIAENP